MVATPQRGTLILRDTAGRGMPLSLYLSDVANAYVGIDNSGYAGTTSPTKHIVQATGFVSEVAIITGTADTKALALLVNGVQKGPILDYVVNVSTNTARPKIEFPISKGDEISFKQLA